MKKYFLALLFFLAFAPVQIVSASADTSEEYFETIDGFDPALDIGTTHTNDFTLIDSYPGTFTINWIQGDTIQKASPTPLAPQELESVVMDSIIIRNDSGEQNSAYFTDPIVLHGLGDTRDEITSTKYTKRIQKTEFCGTWEFLGSQNGINWFSSRNFISNYRYDNNAKMLCSHLSFSGSVEYYDYVYNFPDNSFCYYYNPDYFTPTVLIGTSLASTSDELVELLSGSEFLYELNESYRSNLSSLDKRALERLETYMTISHVVINSPVTPLVDFTYYSYTQAVFEKQLEQFVDFMKMIFDFVRMEFTIWGFTFSYWQVIILSILASLVGVFIHRVFN